MADPNDDIGDLLGSLEGTHYEAPWDWSSLSIDDGDPKLDRLTSGDTLIVEQHAGRKLRLTRLHQYPTYAGMLAGPGQLRDIFVEQAVSVARDIFGKVRVPAILRPHLQALPNPDRLWPPFTAARLPLVTSVADFESEWVADKNDDRSSAIIIWFTDHFGLPTDERILAQLRDLDWPAYAMGYEIG